MARDAATNSHDDELVAGPVWAPGADNLGRFRALSRKSVLVIHSELRGSSMGSALPGGTRIRIRSEATDSWRTSDVIAFLAGSRVMVHRVVYEGRKGAAVRFVITQGDGNWLCDPPVNRATVIGRVEAFSRGGDDWEPVGPRRMSRYRSLTAGMSLAMMRLALEISPSLAICISRPMSWMRMGPRLLMSKLRRCQTGHVWH